MTDFSRTRERLEYELDDGGFTRGAQVVVEVGGERLLDVAVGDNGLGATLTPEHILRVYCTIKPLLAIIVAQLVEDGDDQPRRTPRRTAPRHAIGREAERRCVTC